MMNRPRRPVEHDFGRRALVQHWIRGGTVCLQEQIQSLLKRCLLDSNFLQGPLEGIHEPLGLAVRLGMKRCSRDVFNAVSVAELLEDFTGKLSPVVANQCDWWSESGKYSSQKNDCGM